MSFLILFYYVFTSKTLKKIRPRLILFSALEFATTHKMESLRIFYFQSWARDNTAATTWPCVQLKNGLLLQYVYSIYRCGYSIYNRHRGLNIFRILSCLWCSYYCITLLRFRVVIVANQKKFVACPARFIFEHFLSLT